ncbi:DUF6397 family protein [Streptomyces avicenniae]|uniref:DUF6397 family protein n=1 Tax=Streptomyces avicenniae TaxID=500153 RepID=UPI00069A92C8|nr:DUF6397 family protein [Streptomyces avicenniae]
MSQQSVPSVRPTRPAQPVRPAPSRPSAWPVRSARPVTPGRAAHPARPVRRRVATVVERGAAHPRGDTVSSRRAAHELGLGGAEFEAAVRLGHIGTVPGAAPWERRVARAELDRLRGTPGFSAALRDAARLVNAAAGAELLRISQARFARLARGGCLVPLDFRTNGHRATVWRYPAAELRAFAARRPTLLGGRLPDGLRRALRRCDDWRPPQWRARRTTQLAAQADDPWLRAAVHAAVLPTHSLESAVPDPGERLRLHRLRPPLGEPCRPADGGSAPVPCPATDGLLTVSGPEEERRYRDRLLHALVAARAADRAAGALRAARRPSP